MDKPTQADLEFLESVRDLDVPERIAAQKIRQALEPLTQGERSRVLGAIWRRLNSTP